MSDSIQFATPPSVKAPAASPAAGSATAAAAGTSAAPRSTVIQLAIKERAALHQAYIPLFATGGIFVPSTRDWRIGDDLYLLLTLPEDPQRHPVAGKVAWINPARAHGGRSQGVGVQFPSDDKARQLRVKIEQLLGSHKGSDQSTQTV